MSIRSWRARGFRRPIAIALVSAACGENSRANRPTDPAPVPVAQVTVTPSLGVAIVGLSVQLTAATFDADGRALTGRAVSWLSSDTTKAVVDSRGQVTGIAEGTVTVTATSERQSGSTRLQVVRIDVGSVDVTPSDATIGVGRTQQLTARTLSRTGVPLPGRTVTWSSSDGAIATVSASGLVTAVRVGSVTITATSEGQSATASITVAP